MYSLFEDFFVFSRLDLTNSRMEINFDSTNLQSSFTRKERDLPA